ncbi:MAG: relaxase/mobilization nuclease domain-containing protein [Prolixibacteraceae bacterium]|jgi:hypothetical protein
MIARIVKGQGFRGVVNYILNQEKKAEILDSDGVMLDDPEAIIESFNFQTELNPRILKPVGHISLNFSAQDQEKLSSEFMVKIARDYMTQMGITDTQYFIARHYDKEHPHVHLVFNRIVNNGNTIWDRNDRFRSGKICKELTREYELYFALGKENVKQHRLREPDKTKYEIYNSLKEIIPKSQNWEQIIRGLNDQNMGVTFKYKGKSDEIQGVIFNKNGYTFNGSKVDRQFSYSKINQKLQLKEHKSIQAELQDNAITGYQNQKLFAGNVINDLLYQLQKPSNYSKDNDETAAIRKYRKKKKKDFRLRL